MKENLDCRIIETGKRYIYCLYEDGTITRTNRKSLKETRQTPYVKRQGRNNYPLLKVKFNNKEHIVKQLVAQHFLTYKNGDAITHKDGDFKNCHKDNLIVTTHKELGQWTGDLARSEPIEVVKDGESTWYKSGREAAKSLFVSYQTLYDYLNGRSGKRSVLADYEIRRAK